jgi:hypothetical protein
MAGAMPGHPSAARKGEGKSRKRKLPGFATRDGFEAYAQVSPRPSIVHKRMVSTSSNLTDSATFQFDIKLAKNEIAR